MKFVANVPNPEAHEINVVFRQGLQLIPINCLLYNNDILEIIRRSLVNTYVDDAIVYGKTKNGQSLPTDLLSDLAVACQEGKI